MMKNKTLVLLMAALTAVLMLSACGNKSLSGAPQEPTTNDNSANTSDDNASTGNAANGDILIVIDQTPKPLAEGGSFDFTVKKAPEGYMLKEIHWTSEKNNIVNTLEEAIKHGQEGGNGFYISGNGQFMGFIYPDEMKDETGKVTFVFANDQGKEVTWEKEITLK